MTRGLSDARLRAVAAAGVAAFAVVVYLVFGGGLPGARHYELHADVPSLNGVRAGTPVRVAGVQVGRVTATGPGPRGTSSVTMRIDDEGRPIHRDASLRIRARLFLEGSFSIDLHPGSPSAPELPDGARVPATRTAAPVSFTQVLSTFVADLRTSTTALLHELARGFGGGGAEAAGAAATSLGDVMRDTAIVSRSARGPGRDDAADLVRTNARIAAALAARQDELGRLVTDLRRTTDVLARRDAELGDSVRRSDAVLASAPPALCAIDEVLPDVRDVVSAARPSLRRLPSVLTATDATLAQAARLLRPTELPALLADAGPTVRRLPTLVARLRGLLTLVTPVTDCVRDQALPVLFAAVKDGAHTTGQPTWLELLHGLTNVSASLQTIDGNGMQGRVLASSGEQTLSGTAPGGQTLIGRVTGGPVSSRPVPLGPGRTPPLRPDVTCRDQAPVDLTARTTARANPVAPNAARRTTVSPAQLRRLLDRPLRARRSPR